MNTRLKCLAAAAGMFALVSAAQADCIRSCTAHLYVDLTFQPEGQANVQRKTPTLKTLKNQTRDGRYGGGCTLSGIIKAKERACTSAVESVMRQFSRHFDAQRDAVCQSVENDANSFERARAGFPKADWYAIDKMEAYGEKDRISRRGAIETDRQRFSCDGERAVLVSAQGARPASGGSTAAPPPPPSTTGSSAAPPPPPTAPASGSDARPDLVITQAQLALTGDCAPGRPVLSVRATIRNVGAAPVPIVDYALVDARSASGRWGNGARIEHAIPPGAVANVEFPIYYLQSNPSQMRGRQDFTLSVDPGNKVDERSEGNNSLRRSVTVNCP